MSPQIIKTNTKQEIMPQDSEIEMKIVIPQTKEILKYNDNSFSIV